MAFGKYFIIVTSNNFYLSIGRINDILPLFLPKVKENCTVSPFALHLNRIWHPFRPTGKTAPPTVMGVQPNKKNSFPDYVIDIASERPVRVDSCIERLAMLIYVNVNDTPAQSSAQALKAAPSRL